MVSAKTDVKMTSQKTVAKRIRQTPASPMAVAGNQQAMWRFENTRSGGESFLLKTTQFHRPSRVAWQLLPLPLSVQQQESFMSNPNHYDTLEVSRNASNDAIERMFRHLATKHHPDTGGDKAKFNLLIEAFEVLRHKDSRAAYDQELINETQEISRLVENSKQAGPDAALRHELLCLFYARRREQGSSPSLGEVAIEKTLNLPIHVIEFHLWYFKEKGWITRWESGGYTITAEGVDQIDMTELRIASHRRITSVGNSTAAEGAMVPA